MGRGDLLVHSCEAEPAAEAERIVIGGREGGLVHVEVLRMESVGTSNIGRARRLSAQRHDP